MARETPRGVGILHLVSLLVPLVIVALVLRAMLTPLYLRVAYRLPNFPRDPYGFSQQDRLYWAEKARQYLLNNEDIDFLGRLRFEDGRPVFNARELSHMIDVKRLTRRVLGSGYAALGLIVLLGLWAWRTGRTILFYRAVLRGAWLTLGLMLAVVLFSLLAFTGLFVVFHEVFFPPGTWTFPESDTLIRLFPLRFWRDAFLIFSGASALLALLLLSLLRPRLRPQEQ